MSTENVLLTLVVPHAVEDVVLDVLLAHPDTVHGFTTTCGEGHGDGVELLAPVEQVRGSSRRMCIRIVGARETADATVALLREHLSGANLFYWIVPVLEAGRIK
ncbi:MAG TPA: DUF3240 family protein [Rhodocyclaceae bacterium]|nr:DUF3240 family protein [Rhodocyclaceae bacterium]